MSNIYAGTKSFALRGTLLDRQILERLAESSSMEEFVNRLKTTPYSEEISKVTLPYSSRRLELAFRARLAKVHYSLIQATNSKLVKLFYLKRIGWDLKTVLKAKILNKSYEDILEFVDMRAEELVGRRDLLVKIMSAKDIQEAVSFLSGSEFYEDLEKAVSLYNTNQEIRVIDTYIDHSVLSRISKEYTSNSSSYKTKTNVASIETMIAIEVDSYNVLTALRSKIWNISENETLSILIRPTYNVPIETLNNIVSASTVQEAVRLLPEKYVAGETQLSNEELIAYVEQKFREESLDIAAKAFVWQGLSVATALALIKLLENEVNNLAAISVGIESGIESKKIISSLLFVM